MFRSIRVLLSSLTIFFMLGAVVFARVDNNIKKKYEGMYEEKRYYLRVPFVTYEDFSGKASFYTDLDSFLYPDKKDDFSSSTIFMKGAYIIIDKIDFDAKKITLDFSRDSGNDRGELIFEFGERLSDDFDVSSSFTRRFDEIFLKESLKLLPDSSDKISNIMQKEGIAVGSHVDEVVLTFGLPSDIVKHVTSEGNQDKYIYKIGGKRLILSFENSILKEWLEY